MNSIHAKLIQEWCRIPAQELENHPGGKVPLRLCADSLDAAAEDLERFQPPQFLNRADQGLFHECRKPAAQDVCCAIWYSQVAVVSSELKWRRATARRKFPVTRSSNTRKFES